MMAISLKAARVNADMTIKEWAKAIGVSPSTIINWESGKTQPGATALVKISELSGVPLDFIFCTTIPKNAKGCTD